MSAVATATSTSTHRIVYRGAIDGRHFKVQENRPANGIDHWRTIDSFENLVHARRAFRDAEIDNAVELHQQELEKRPHTFEPSFYEPAECRFCGIHFNVHGKRGGAR